MLGWVGHRNGDRDCEPAQLTEHPATVGLGMGEIREGFPAYRAPEPRHGRPWRGFVIPERGNDAERLGISTYCGEVPKLGEPSDRTACQEEIGKYSSIIGNGRCRTSKTAWQITEGTAREIALSASQCARDRSGRMTGTAERQRDGTTLFRDGQGRMTSSATAPRR